MRIIKSWVSVSITASYWSAAAPDCSRNNYGSIAHGIHLDYSPFGAPLSSGSSTCTALPSYQWTVGVYIFNFGQQHYSGSRASKTTSRRHRACLGLCDLDMFNDIGPYFSGNQMYQRSYDQGLSSILPTYSISCIHPVL